VSILFGGEVMDKKPPYEVVTLDGHELLFTVARTEMPWPWLVSVLVWPDAIFIDLFHAKEEIEAGRLMRREAQLVEMGKKVGQKWPKEV